MKLEIVLGFDENWKRDRNIEILNELEQISFK